MAERPDGQRPDAESGDEGPDPEHVRPDGVDDATVSALGKLSEALEAVEHARGLLYGFHRLSGRADILLGEALEELDGAGHGKVASRLRSAGDGARRVGHRGVPSVAA